MSIAPRIKRIFPCPTCGSPAVDGDIPIGVLKVGVWCDQFNKLCQEWAAGRIDDGDRAITFMRRMCAVIGTTLGDEE